jgi:hypothetical protein
MEADGTLLHVKKPAKKQLLHAQQPRCSCLCALDVRCSNGMQVLDMSASSTNVFSCAG